MTSAPMTIAARSNSATPAEEIMVRPITRKVTIRVLPPRRAKAKDQEQTDADQQHAADRVITQERNQQQADAGGQHRDQRPAPVRP